MINWKRTNRSVGRFAAWTRDPVSASAFWWKWHVKLGRESAGGLGQDLYREVRYEALVADPAGECTELCTFLGLPYADTMLEFHEGRTKTKPGLDAKRAWLPITRGLRDWRSEMRTEDLERFEAAAGDLLEELGYPRVESNFSEERLENAASIQASLAREVRARTDYPLPERP